MRGCWSGPSHAGNSRSHPYHLGLGFLANIAGLQLADLLGHPVKQWVLKHYGNIASALAPFAQRLMRVARCRWRRGLRYAILQTG